MKALFCACLLTASLASLRAADVPTLEAPEVAAIAQSDLEKRSLQDRIFIAQVTFKEKTFGGADYWEVLWSDTFPAQTEGRNEFGLRITMDGSYTRLVK